MNNGIISFSSDQENISSAELLPQDKDSDILSLRPKSFTVVMAIGFGLCGQRQEKMPTIGTQNARAMYL